MGIIEIVILFSQLVPLGTFCLIPYSIRPSTRFRRLPVWVSKADIVACLKLSPTDAQALFDSAPRRCLIDGVEKISKYQLQTAPYPDLIRTMQRHPSRPSIQLFR